MFIKISKKIEYALIVLHHLDGEINDQSTTARSLSDLYNIPFDTTAKVMQQLANEGILESTQGINGGYKLLARLENLNYIHIYEIIERKSPESDCESIQCKLIDTCNISKPITNLNQNLLGYLQALSLKEIFNSKTPKNILNEAIHGQ